MTKKIFLTLLLITVASLYSAEILYNTSLSFATNYSLASTIGISGYPTGDVVLAGTPFSLGSNPQVWHSEIAGGTNPRILDVAAGIYGAQKVYTLINTYWGQKTGTYASIEFYGSAGATYTKYLYGNSDIRDYNPNGGVWTETINNTTTVNAWTAPTGHRLDKQTITLPVEFLTQTLTTIRFIDNGGNSVQRIFLTGVTVASIPEPSSIVLFGMAGILLLFFKK